MKWSRAELLQADKQTIDFTDTIAFDPAAFAKMHQIRGLQDVTVSGNIHYLSLIHIFVQELGGEVVGCGFLIELEGLQGREHLKDYEVFSLMSYK